MKKTHLTIMSVAAALALVSLAGVATTNANSITNGADNANRPTISEELKLEFKAIKEEAKLDIEAAVAANDFAAFTAVKESTKADLQALRDANGIEARTSRGDRADRVELTEEEKLEKMQAKFEKMVEYYAENGELPTRKMKGKRGNRGAHTTVTTGDVG